MVRCETLWICLLAVVSLLASINTLPLSPSEESSRGSGKQPQVTQGMTGGVLEPAMSIFPLLALDWLSQNIMPTNQMEQLSSDSSSLQLQAGKARLRSSGHRVESTAVGPIELHGEAEAAPATVKAMLGSEGEVLSEQTQGDDSQDNLRCKRMEHGLAAPNNQSQRTKRVLVDGPNQGDLLAGRAWHSSARQRESGSSGPPSAARNTHGLSRAPRADPMEAVAMGFSGIPLTPSGAQELEPAGAPKQDVSNETINLPSLSQAPVGQEPSSVGEMRAGPRVNFGIQVKDPNISRTQSQAGPLELGTLSSAREEPGAQGNTRGAETTKKPPKKHLGVPDDGFQTTTAVSSEAMATASEPSLSSTPPSEQTRPGQSALMDDSILQSTPLVSNIRESKAASAPSSSAPISHHHIITSPSIEESSAGASPVQSGSPGDPAGPRPTKPPQGGHLSTEQRVTAIPWARGALQQDAVKSSIPSDQQHPRDHGVTRPLLVTAWTETRTRGGNQALKALPFRRADEATPAPEDILLIFEPLEDALSEVVVTAAPGGTQQVSQFSGIKADTQDILTGPELVAAVVAGGGPSPSGGAPPALPSGPIKPWQTSGTKMLEKLRPSTLSLFTAPPPEPPLDYGILYPEKLGMIDTPTGTTEGSPSSFKTQGNVTTEQTPQTTVATATSMPLPRHESGLDVPESKEDHDDEETEASKEAGSEEDMTEVTTVVHIRPTYTHIPYHFHAGSIWVQRNQGLVHSWVEKIRDKAGYVSGMLAPVGIGIAGALFILGALYSIKVMHRKKRNGYKRQRRKHRETSSRQDRVMLLADSSEDEF